MADILTDSELLVKFGFIKESCRHMYKYDDKKEHYVMREEYKKEEKEYDKSHANEEMDEENNLSTTNAYQKTGYPKTPKRYRLITESFNMSLEELYYWCLNYIRQDAGFSKVDKILDTFSAAENSAFFGQSVQRRAIQEDRASGFLRGISELVKTLFQIVRELRVIDERLEIYKNWKTSKSADATLKGLFADFAENKGGQMQPGSVFHLSQQVGYAALPDLFFNTIVNSTDEIDEVVDKLEFNKNVKTVLKRKLYQFLVWTEKTEKELYTRKRFQVKYLRQHYVTIKTYISWVKPYLKHIKRLQMSEEQMDSPDIISTFESSATEIEILAQNPSPKGDIHGCTLMTFKFNTRPVLNYNQDAARGPVHIGKGEATFRSYGWTDHQIKMYKKMKDYEDRELLGMVDDQLQSAMEMLGDDLEKYLKLAEGEIEEEENEKKETKPTKLTPIEGNINVFEPFISMFKGFGEIGKAFMPSTVSKKQKSKGKSKTLIPKDKASEGVAMGIAKLHMWLVYKNYKKAHGMMAW